MPEKKMTESVVAMIRPWREQGLSTADIAEKIGCTVGTLRVRCSKMKISLRRTERERPNSQLLEIDLPPATLQSLRDKAYIQGTHHSLLVAALLEKISQDNLYDAILDD